MAEEQNIVLAEREGHRGAIQIAPQVIEIILGIAAKQIDGVYEMRGNLASSINYLLGRQDHGRGVELTVDGERLSANVYVYLNYGVSVPKVALEMQQTLKEQLYYMTDLKLAEVNVHVEGIVPEKEAKVDPKTFFADAADEAEENDAESAEAVNDGATPSPAPDQPAGE
ncbi:Asp23/Gls24 family envelope stress response protein [Lapidilactobacillus achengensis]|uniref:Asp23/Gls24 family envelope stress response protein n=1 Tax=Lapidilactobacillus achengensis TaxID=2486000 RepID=A0ABW1UQM7_9LACO|nr:Asp23/Gls24 family envelope stress response protein [Lapidilactobacillus achengensis]